jgi:hypothetical protein
MSRPTDPGTYSGPPAPTYFLPNKTMEDGLSKPKVSPAAGRKESQARNSDFFPDAVERKAQEDERLDVLHAAAIAIRDTADELARVVERRAGQTRLQMQRRIRDRAERRRLVGKYGKNWKELIGRAEWESRGRPSDG